MSNWLYLTEGFTLGISLGMTCLATCGPVYLPYIMSSENKPSRSFLIVLYITLGRFISYLLFGLITGMIGKHITEISRTSFTSIAYIGLSLLLIYQSIIKGRITHEKCEIRKWQKGLMNPFLLGILTGINFCPAFLIALTRSFYISGIVASILLFFSFFLGTSLFIIPLSLGGLFTRWDKIREIARIVAIFIGIWYLGQGLWLIFQMIKK